jgi:hypothetical protein
MKESQNIYDRIKSRAEYLRYLAMKYNKVIIVASKK